MEIRRTITATVRRRRDAVGEFTEALLPRKGGPRIEMRGSFLAA
jgi:hypothetical protein